MRKIKIEKVIIPASYISFSGIRKKCLNCDTNKFKVIGDLNEDETLIQCKHCKELFVYFKDSEKIM